MLTVQDAPRLSATDCLYYASTFPTVGDWLLMHPGSYYAAQSQGLMTQALTRLGTGQTEGTRWSPQTCIESARHYPTRSAWMQGQGGAYLAAKRFGVFEHAVAHMPVRAKTRPRPRKWTVARCLQDAAGYVTKSEWQASSRSAYNAAKRLKVFDLATAHMTRKRKWHEAACLKDAANYTTKSAWQHASRSAYHAAKHLGIFELATAHMPKNCRYV